MVNTSAPTRIMKHMTYLWNQGLKEGITSSSTVDKVHHNFRVHFKDHRTNELQDSSPLWCPRYNPHTSKITRESRDKTNNSSTSSADWDEALKETINIIDIYGARGRRHPSNLNPAMRAFNEHQHRVQQIFSDGATAQWFELVPLVTERCGWR